MDNTNLQEKIEKYKNELIEMSKLSGNKTLDNEKTQTPQTNGQENQSNRVIEIESPELGVEENYPPDDSKHMSFNDFMTKNPETGKLKVQTFYRSGLGPVIDAKITVAKTFSDGEHIFFTGKTDENGIIDNISLPSPSSTVSKSPSKVQPYSEYEIRFEHPDYVPEVFHGVPIYSGIKSIQSAYLQPIGVDNSDYKGQIPTRLLS